MISLNVLFWILVILFAIIGMSRGWAKELLVSFSLILALFIIMVLEQYAPFLASMITAGGRPLFWLRAVIVILLVFFGYQGPNLPRLAGTGKFARERLQELPAGVLPGRHQRLSGLGHDLVLPQHGRLSLSGILPGPGRTDRGFDRELDQDHAARLVEHPGDLLRRCNRICVCTGGVLVKKHVHFIGIGGTGLSAIARLLLESGYEVSGSDRTASPLARDIESAGAQVFIGHAAEQVHGADVVVRSSAVKDDNPEVVEARKLGIPVLKRSDFLGQFIAGHTGIAVAGTHGKTTTTAMIAWMLSRLNADPSFIIGGVSKNLGCNAHAGQGSAFVIEADEYDRMFLGLQPEWIVLTNLEHDHPDCYPTPEDYFQAFAEFIGQLRPGGGLLVCRDDERAFELIQAAPDGCQALSYGLHPQADYQATHLDSTANGGAGFRFEARYRGKPLAQVDLQVPGKHNVSNALASLAIADRLGLNTQQAAMTLGEFLGTGRRFDVLGKAGGVTVIDDYGHHPTEIRATLAAARARYPEQRIWAVWQPHTYSRTQTLLDGFLHAFGDADRVVITEVYAARETNDHFSAALMAAQMPHPAVEFAPTTQAATQSLARQLQPGDVLIVLSAGDADQVSAAVLKNLQAKE